MPTADVRKAIARSRQKLLGQPDVWVCDEGSVFAFEPLSGEARVWIDEHVQHEAYQWLGRRLVVEHRFAVDLIRGMKDAGLVVEVA